MNISANRKFLVPLAAVVLVLGLAAVWGVRGGSAGEGLPAWGADPARSNNGAVQFVLTPRKISWGRFPVDIVITTHSGDLATLNLKEATELRFGGRTLRPVKVPALRGHHVRGKLEFPVEWVPDTFEIVIRGVPDMGDLTFRWP